MSATEAVRLALPSAAENQRGKSTMIDVTQTDPATPAETTPQEDAAAAAAAVLKDEPIEKEIPAWQAELADDPEPEPDASDAEAGDDAGTIEADHDRPSTADEYSIPTETTLTKRDAPALMSFFETAHVAGVGQDRVEMLIASYDAAVEAGEPLTQAQVDKVFTDANVTGLARDDLLRWVESQAGDVEASPVSSLETARGELKAALGSDYQSAIRDVKNYLKSTGQEKAVLGMKDANGNPALNNPEYVLSLVAAARRGASMAKPASNREITSRADAAAMWGDEASMERIAMRAARGQTVEYSDDQVDDFEMARRARGGK